MKKFIYLLLLAFTGFSLSAQDSQGQDFWVAFPGNYSQGPIPLYITGATNTTGTVSIPGLAFTQNFTVTAGAITTVSLPVGVHINTFDAAVNLGIHVTSLADISLYGFSEYQYSTDAFLAFPTDAIGKDYTIMSYKNVNVVNGTQFGIVAAEAGTTTVTITPSVTTGSRTAGVPYNITLTQGQAYVLKNTGSAPNDLTGTFISADKNISVFGSHNCANIPNGTTYACDYLIEQLPPNSSWGTSFGTVPLAARTGGDTFRVLAQSASTAVSINGVNVANLNAGQYYETILSGYNYITSSKPVLVGQFSNGTTWDNQLYGDPFFLLVPPTDQFLVNYTVNSGTPTMNVNFLNIVASTSQTAGVTVDGNPVPGASWTVIPGSSFSGAQVSVTAGQHSVNSTFPIGLFIYGFGAADSYGYLGGQSFSPVATVSQLSLNLSATTAYQAQQVCFTATVLDQNNNPVAGVLVNYTVAGVTNTAGFGLTNAQGQVILCYTTCLAGNDVFTATIAGLSDFVNVTVLPTTFSVSPNAVNVSAGQQACATATVIDGSNNPVPNAVVTYSVSGANNVAPQNVLTNGAGQALMCYTATNSGNDVITATYGCALGAPELVNVSVGGGGPCPPGPTITLTPAGLNANPWGNGGANDPFTFYYGLSNNKLIKSTINPPGSYTYAWTSSLGPNSLMPTALPGRINLFEPTGPAVVTLTITDQNSGCQYSQSITINWSDYYFCNHLAANPWTWYIYVCQNGTTQCVTWNAAKAMLTANPPTATLGPCTPKTDITSQASGFNVYPNPSNGLFTLELPIAANSKGSVEVMDVNGRALYSETIDVTEGMLYHTLDLGTLPNGIYFVRVTTDNELATERIQIIR